MRAVAARAVAVKAVAVEAVQAVNHIGVEQTALRTALQTRTAE